MTTPMPAAFLGHGTPMNALETNRFTAAWRAFGESVPKPRAILVVSAHWYVHVTAVTAMARPRTIHDFHGFPPELFAVDYPAPGEPDVAREVALALQPVHCGLDLDSWGLDHGAWSVLVHAFPRADVPVLQLSIDATKDAAFHFELGARLAPLRERGILILGSGNVVHNLRALDWDRPEAAFDWAQRFDAAARAAVTGRASDVLELPRHRDYRMAVPTTEHFDPLLTFAGLCSRAGRPADVLVDGFAFGSLSMASYTLDAPARPANDERQGSAGIPDPALVPPEDTNL